MITSQWNSREVRINHVSHAEAPRPLARPHKDMFNAQVTFLVNSRHTLPLSPIHSHISFHPLFSSVFPAARSSLCWLMSEWWVTALLPYSPAPAVFFMRGKEMAFSEWEWLIVSGNSQWDTLLFFPLRSHRTVLCGLHTECDQEQNAAAKVEALCNHSFTAVLKWADVTLFLPGLIPLQTNI